MGSVEPERVRYANARRTFFIGCIGRKLKAALRVQRAALLLLRVAKRSGAAAEFHSGCGEGLDRGLVPGFEAVLRAELQESRLGRRVLLLEADLVPVGAHHKREMRSDAGTRDHLAIGDLEHGDFFHAEFDAALPRRAPEDLADFDVASADIESVEAVQLHPGRNRNADRQDGEPTDDGEEAQGSGDEQGFADFHERSPWLRCGLEKNY